MGTDYSGVVVYGTPGDGVVLLKEVEGSIYDTVRFSGVAVTSSQTAMIVGTVGWDAVVMEFNFTTNTVAQQELIETNSFDYALDLTVLSGNVFVAGATKDKGALWAYNSSLELLWEENLELQGSTQMFHGLTNTNNGFALVGTKEDVVTGARDVVVVRTDNDGNAPDFVRQ